MPSMLRALACLCVSTSAALLAQNDTVPSLLNGLEGGSGTSIPFGLSQPVRIQFVYDSEELPWTGPRVITRVSMRADNADPNVTTFAPKGFVFVSMLLSTTSRKAEATTATFEENYGSDAMLVLDNVPMMLPAQPALPGARPANIDFVLPTPWIFGMTPVRPNQPAPSNLLIELRIHSQPVGAYRIDNVGSCSIPPVAFGSNGPLCVPAGGPPLQLSGGNSLVAGASYTWTISNATPSAPTFLMIGVETTGSLFGVPTLPLPVALFDAADPLRANPAMTAIAPGLLYGAPDCWIDVLPIDTMFAMANAGGVATVTIGISANRDLVGESLFAQAIGFTQTANPLQYVTSLGQQSTVCGPIGVARIYTLGTVTSTTGQRSLGQGAVFELH